MVARVSIWAAKTKHAMQSETSQTTYAVERSALLCKSSLGTASRICLRVTFVGTKGRASLACHSVHDASQGITECKPGLILWGVGEHYERAFAVMQYGEARRARDMDGEAASEAEIGMVANGKVYNSIYTVQKLIFCRQTGCLPMINL